MNCFTIFLCLCATATASPLCTCDSGQSCSTNLPEPKETTCGLISQSNVTILKDSFKNFTANVSRLIEYKASPFVPMGLDPFYDYHQLESDDNCWIFVPLPTRIYLDFTTLKKFTEPLGHFLSYEQGNVDASKDARIHSQNITVLIYNLERNIHALDCVMNYTGITSDASRKLPQIKKQRTPIQAPTFETVYDYYRMLYELNTVIVRVHHDLIEMSQCRPPKLHLPEWCPLK